MEERRSDSGTSRLLVLLPIVAGAIALITYLITLTPWLLFRNVQSAAMAGGWDWTAGTNHFVPPLLYLITFPLRLFGDTPSPYLLNLISAFLGAGTVVMLASCIQYFPQDRTREQRIREKSHAGILTGPYAWVPVIAGSLLFTFSLTVWESSTAFTTEMVNLLVFSVILRAIFKTRIDGNDMRLVIGAFFTGIALVNDGGFIGFLPFIIAGFIWVKKKEIITFQFLMPAAVSFIAGLLLYLLVPIIHPYNGVDGVGYFERLFSYLGNQKSYILLRDFRLPAIIFGLTSVVPLIFATIRWPGQFGDMSAVGAFFSQIMFRVFHVVFLFATLYICFDQAHSPRQSELGDSLLYLRYHFLTCLAFSYYLGYFIIMLSKASESRRRKRPVLPPEFSRVLAIAICFIGLAAPAVLIAKNFGFIQGQKSTPWKEYAQTLAAGLDLENKTTPALVGANSIQPGTSKDLMMLRAVLSSAAVKNAIFYDASPEYLGNPKYHALMKSRYGNHYPDLPNLPESQETYSNLQIGKLFRSIIDGRSAYYLNPSFGMFFEVVHTEPLQLANELVPYGTREIEYTNLSQERIDRLNGLTADLQESLVTPLKKLRKLDPPRSRFAGGIKSATDPETLCLALGLRLNDLGYRLMRAGEFETARKYFEMCQSVQPDNFSAKINMFALTILEKTESAPKSSDWKFPEDLNEDINEQLKLMPDLDTLLSFYGFFDNPTLTFPLSRVFFENGLPRQGYQFFTRTVELDPTNYEYYAEGALLILNQKRPDIVRRLLEKFRENVDSASLPFEDQNLEVKIESQILFREGKLDEAVKLLEADAAAHPSRESTLRFLVGIYESAQKYKEAIDTATIQLAKFPNDFRTLLKLGFAHSMIEQYEEALNANVKALKLNESFWHAHKNNAYVYSQLGQWENVVSSIEEVRKILPNYHQGLLEIAHAYVQLDENEKALKFLEDYLVTLPSGSDMASTVQMQIDELKKNL